MDYAIIRLGGKQYRVREGEYLVVDRLATEAGKSFSPDVLLGDDGVAVTATVLSHERGPKIRIGKYKKRTGYKRHNGFRAATSRVEISLGAPKKAAATKQAEPSEAAAPEVAAPEVAAPEAAAPEIPAPASEAATPDPAASAPAADDHVKGMPAGYEEMTVAQVAEGAKTWNRPMLEAALTYEQAHAARKGATAAIESALQAKEEDA
jgi:large subunit ribosomal protein L21